MGGCGGPGGPPPGSDERVTPLYLKGGPGAQPPAAGGPPEARRRGDYELGKNELHEVQ